MIRRRVGRIVLEFVSLGIKESRGLDIGWGGDCWPVVEQRGETHLGK